jgi:hypothetical protein
MAKNKGEKGKAETYAAPKKGTGKPKYKNTIKEARVNTKKPTVTRLAGETLTKTEAKARMRKAPNLPKQIAKEEKIRTGVNTAKPATPKVPVKPRGGRGGMGGGVFGIKNR